MSGWRRLLCLSIGVPLLLAGSYLAFVHIANSDAPRTRMVLAAGAMAFGGCVLVGSAITGR